MRVRPEAGATRHSLPSLLVVSTSARLRRWSARGGFRA